MKYLIAFLMVVVLSVVGTFFYFYSQVKFNANKIINYDPPLSTRIYDRNGVLLANLFDKENRLYARYEEIPPRVIEALVAIEDTSFFEHKGINLEAIFRAAMKDIKEMRLAQGASTITQQLIKNTLLTREKKFRRKINEIIIAIKLENSLSKEEILERYLNQVYFGHGYYGIKTAALGYFHKELAELNLKEIAVLVGLPKAPSLYDPTKHPDFASARANRVLSRMRALGWITEDEFKEYEKYSLVVKKRGDKNGDDNVSEENSIIVYDDSLTLNKAPYLVDQTLRELRKYGDYKDIKTGGYKIYLNIDTDIQQIAEDALKRAYNELLERHKDQNNSSLNGAMVVMRNSTGEVLAMVGGVDYKKSAFNRATQSKRQPGSSFKPFIYQIALNLGYSPASEVADISRIYKSSDPDKDDWKPKNYERNYEGLITLKEALVHSRNLATINLVNEIGLDVVIEELKKFGFKNLPPNLSMPLGTFGISPYEFAGFYTIFSNYGKKVTPVFIKKIVDKYGNEKVFASEERTVEPSKQAYLIIDMLKDVIKRGTARKAKVKGIELAGKTGTTNNYVDAWFCGFSPEIEVITWFGRDDNKPIGRRETGGRAAAPAFKYFFEDYLTLHPETKREFDVPVGVRKTRIGSKTILFTDISKPPKRSYDSVVSPEEEMLF